MKKQQQQQRRMGDVSVHDHHVDRISKLPEEMIHMIMSSFAKDDIHRLSTVSKKFFSAAQSCPIFDFDFSRFTYNNTQISEFEAEDSVPEIESFLNYVVEFFERNAGNTRYFRNLNFAGPIGFRQRGRVIELVQQALENETRVLNLDVLGKGDGRIFRRKACTVPPAIFSAEHVKVLKLRGFSFPSDLQELDLSCPLMEDLCLSHCRGLKTVNLRGSNLKRVVLDTVSGLNKVTIGPEVRLESFSHTGFVCKVLDFPDAFGLGRRLPRSEHICDVDLLHSCESLKFLEIKNNKNIVTDGDCFQPDASHFNSIETLKIDTCILESLERTYDNNLRSFKCLKFLEIRNTDVFTEELFRANASLFNSLETLKIAECQNLGNVDITSKNLKTFELETSSEVQSIYIDAPSLESFLCHIDCMEYRIDVSRCINLKHLDLKGVGMAASPFHRDNQENTHHFPQFNLLETLKLDSCSMLKTVHILGNNLKSFELRNCDMLEEIYIESNNLKSFELRSCGRLEKIDIRALSLELFVFEFRGSWNRCEINISTCANLKHLRLRGAIVRKDFFVVPFTEKLVFPSLEKLELEACRLEDGIELYRKCLRSFKLVDCINWSEIKIEAPNLDSFMFKSDGNGVQLSYLLRISPPSSLVPKLFVTTLPSDITDSFRRSFRTFLSSFSDCKTLFLSCTSSEVMIFSKKMRESLHPPLSGVKHVKVQVEEWPRVSIEELLASLLWLVSFPETMSISSMYPAKKPLELKFHYDPVVEEGDVRCLKHHLTEVEVENFSSLEEKTKIHDFFNGAFGMVPAAGSSKLVKG